MMFITITVAIAAVIYVIIMAYILIFRFNRKNKKVNTVFDFKKDIDYKFISFSGKNEDGSEKFAEIELLTGQFTGVRYTYGNVSSFTEEEDEENAQISFEYFLTENAGNEDLENNVDFKNHIGEVLVSMILTSMEEQKALDQMINSMQIVDEETGTKIE